MEKKLIEETQKTQEENLEKEGLSKIIMGRNIAPLALQPALHYSNYGFNSKLFPVAYMHTRRQMNGPHGYGHLYHETCPGTTCPFKLLIHL